VYEDQVLPGAVKLTQARGKPLSIPKRRSGRLLAHTLHQTMSVAIF
jgi:hypothetical protein